MVSSTRQRIVQYLHTQRRCTVPQLSAAFHMTRANMRYHLDRLVAEGMIEMTSQPSTGKGRGRPVHTYQLAVSAHKSNLAELADALLDQITEEDAMRRLAQALAGEQDLPRQITQRLNRVIQILNLKRYQARWEAHTQGPRIILHNCPYAAVLADHPEMCRVDAYLLEHLSGTTVEQLVRMDIFDSQPPACLFSVQV